MKRSATTSSLLLMLVSLFVLQSSSKLHASVLAHEYSDVYEQQQQTADFFPPHEHHHHHHHQQQQQQQYEYWPPGTGQQPSAAKMYQEEHMSQPASFQQNQHQQQHEHWLEAQAGSALESHQIEYAPQSESLHQQHQHWSEVQPSSEAAHTSYHQTEHAQQNVGSQTRQQQQQQQHPQQQQQQQQHNAQQLNHIPSHQPDLVVEEQQVMVHDSRHGYRYAQTNIRLRQESKQLRESSELYIHNVVQEISYPLLMMQEFQDQHHANQAPYTTVQHRHVILRHSSQEHDAEHATYYHHPPTSCESHENPSMLMMSTHYGEPTCRATSNSHMNGPLTDSSRNVPNFSPYTKPSQNSNVESFPIAPPHYHYESSLMAAIRHYWREVSGLCLASAIFLNWLFVVVKRRFIASGLNRAEHAIEAIQRGSSTSTSISATKSLTKDTNSSSAHDSAFEENVSPISLNESDSSSRGSLIQKDKSTFSLGAMTETPVLRQRSSTLKAEPIPIPAPTGGHTSLSNSLSNTSSDYNSRYSSDFDSIQRLGRGGFGIVFEAKNKIDDCHYAVKRICLPLEKEARERVMREVRALAKLDHAGIVRYYNAWLETPPDDWLKQHDAQLGIVNSKDGMSFPSTDGIYEKNDYEDITKGYGGGGDIKSGRRGQMSDCCDDSENLLGKNPFKVRSNGYHNKYMRENSSSPSLDIVFEGSGSIRVEADDKSAKFNQGERGKTKHHKNTRKPFGQINRNNGDNNDSDSEDSDFIQFESKTSNGKKPTAINGIDNDGDWSASSHLTEPFSSSDSELDESSLGDDRENQVDGVFRLDDGRKNALAHQREMRRLNNASMVENLHIEKVYLYIQMQLCRKDTLKDWLRTNCETRDKTTVFDLFYQIVDAVEYVHSQDLIHRDLKPSNIFFSLDGTLKIGDFGLCRAKTSVGVGSSLDLQEYVAESDVERGFEAVHTEQVGTQLYMSPEQLSGLSYNQKVDIFAMGLILLELLVPFKTQMQRVNVLFKARNNLYADEFKTEHPKEHELVRSLLNRCAHKRPTASEIKQHDLLANAQLSQPVIERIYHRRRTISSNSSTE